MIKKLLPLWRPCLPLLQYIDTLREQLAELRVQQEDLGYVTFRLGVKRLRLRLSILDLLQISVRELRLHL